MLELNRAERKALVVAAALLALGAIVRESRAPGAAIWSWRPASEAGVALSEVRARVGEGVEREEEAARPLAPGERLDPNEVSEAQLRRLPGIGPTRARAIVEARGRQRFRAPEDLLRVPGIGEATLARIASHLEVRRGGGRAPAVAGAAPVPVGGAPVSGARRGNVGRPAGVAAGCAGLDLNRATAAELERLPWIGPARARQVLETRERLAGFHSVDQLVEVPGIGPYTLERLRPLVCVG